MLPVNLWIAFRICMHMFKGGELWDHAVIDINGTIPVDSNLGQLGTSLLTSPYARDVGDG